MNFPPLVEGESGRPATYSKFRVQNSLPMNQKWFGKSVRRFSRIHTMQAIRSRRRYWQYWKNVDNQGMIRSLRPLKLCTH